MSAIYSIPEGLVIGAFVRPVRKSRYISKTYFQISKPKGRVRWSPHKFPWMLSQISRPGWRTPGGAPGCFSAKIQLPCSKCLLKGRCCILWPPENQQAECFEHCSRTYRQELCSWLVQLAGTVPLPPLVAMVTCALSSGWSRRCHVSSLVAVLHRNPSVSVGKLCSCLQ